MRRAWIGASLLAGALLLGAGSYQPPNWPACIVLVLAGLGFLVRREPLALPGGLGLTALVLLIPPGWILPWPLKILPLLLMGGLILLLSPIPREWTRRAGTALVEAAALLLAQGMALWIYGALTASSHELPACCGRALAEVARMLGLTAAYTGRDVALFSMRRVHLLGATWELLLDPATVCFLAGGLTLLVLRRAANGRTVGRLLLCVLIWLPLRAGLLMALLLHRTLLTDYDAALRLMNQFWSPWLLLALLAGLALLATRLVCLPVSSADGVARPAVARPSRKEARALGLALLGAVLVAVGLLWEPEGRRKGGRVFVDEYHSTWEPTDRPFDTSWYGHDAGYNYACIYDYCSRFYEMCRLETEIGERTLDDCDVLVLKVPTKPYRPAEVNAIQRFVEGGGGVLLIGEHTDVFLTSTHLNQIARLCGFEFRKDCLFGIQSPFEQVYRPPVVPHPILQHMPYLDFAVSCSIRPLSCGGRPVIRASGLWSLPADYRASNFYPQVEDRADARYGSFFQMWAARRGAGRVVAFADSTVFSNFSTFEPGKSELMIGMIEWLNHVSRLSVPRGWLVAVGALMCAGSLLVIRAGAALPWLASAALCGWSLAAVGIRFQNRWAMPFPEPLRPLTRVVVDRTVSDAPLSMSGFIKASPEGFGIFEQWILRLGYFTARTEGDAVFAGDAIVFLHPHKAVSDAFRTRLAGYVKAGGKLLVLDSALNRKSTANSLLYPFGMSVDMDSDSEGTLEAPHAWPSVPAQSVRRVKGGEPLVRLGGETVAAKALHGKGAVMAVGFGARFNDDSMGITTDIEPTPDLRQVYELEFQLLRDLIGGD